VSIRRADGRRATYSRLNAHIDNCAGTNLVA
jgi:hypothetical protein